MTEQVRIEGHNVPGVPAGAVVAQHSREGGQQPAPVAPSPAAYAQAPQPAQQEFQSLSQPQQAATQPNPQDATLAALLAALKSAQPAAPAAAPAPVASPVPAGGDAVTVGLTNILASSGLDVQRAIGNALAHGDASLIDLRYIAEAGGANAAHLTQVAQGLVDHAVREENALAESVYTAAGGEANWRAALGAFEASAPGHLQAVVRTLYDSKDRANITAATTTILEFAKAAGVQVVPAGIFAGGAQGGAVQALSKEQFQAELQKLDKNARGYEQARAELFVRRHAGKQLGR